MPIELGCIIILISFFSSMSFASMSITEENESAYGGSQTGTLSSVRSMTQVPENTATNFDNDDDKIDVGLTVRLQHKLKETQLAKEKLEKRLEQLELRGMGIIVKIWT